jgi:GNAT superfamily N-acetyltransferase
MHIERIPPSLLQPADDEELGRMGAEAFPVPWAEPVGHWAPTEFQFIARDVTGKIVSSVGLVKRVAKAGGAEVLVGGIGGVMTATAARGHGYARALMSAAAECMRNELQASFGLLQCPTHRISFYESLNWVHVKTAMWFSQPDGSRRATPENAMVLQLTDAIWPDGVIDMNGLPW